MFLTERAGRILYAWASGILYRRMTPKCMTPFILFLLPLGCECSPALKPWSLINGLFEKESLVMNIFFKEEGEAC